MKKQFTAKIRNLSQNNKGITIPKNIADLWENGRKVKITMEKHKK